MRVYEIKGNSQRLDGGALFGNAPRALWSRWHEPDELNRISLACRALLVQCEAGNVLLETGIGAFFPPDLRDRFGVMEEEHVLLDSLADLKLTDADINVVILSHLHFDHAGGLLSRYAPGETPTLLFPNALYVTSEEAYARAQTPHPRDRVSFIEALPQLLEETGRLRLIGAEQQHLPDLGETFQFRQTNGHTPGMLHTTVHGDSSEVFFCADLVPGRAWVRPTISMGYDRYPELLLDEKSKVLAEAEQRRTWLFFTHDSDVAMARVTRDARGQYAPTEEVASLPVEGFAV